MRCLGIATQPTNTPLRYIHAQGCRLRALATPPKGPLRAPKPDDVVALHLVESAATENRQVVGHQVAVQEAKRSEVALDLRHPVEDSMSIALGAVATDVGPAGSESTAAGMKSGFVMLAWSPHAIPQHNHPLPLRTCSSYATGSGWSAKDFDPCASSCRQQHLWAVSRSDVRDLFALFTRAVLQWYFGLWEWTFPQTVSSRGP
jgi:hypothetical protein